MIREVSMDTASRRGKSEVDFLLLWSFRHYLGSICFSEASESKAKLKHAEGLNERVFHSLVL